MRWRSSAGTSAALLGIGLELRLQGGEFCKGRIRIRWLVTLAALETLWTGRPLPIALARWPVEALLGFLPAMVALVTFRVRLLGALSAWRRSGRLRCGDGWNSLIRPARRALLRGLVPTRFATLEARTARAIGPGHPARPPDFDHDRFFGGFFFGRLILPNVDARLDDRWRWRSFSLHFWARGDELRRRLQRCFHRLPYSFVADLGNARRCFVFNI